MTKGTKFRLVVIVRCAAAALLASALALGASADGFDAKLWSGLRYRMIGPERGGRVTAVTGVPSEPFTFYMGSTGGGVWKTVDAGHNWTNVSDGFFSVASMGAIDVSLSDPNVIYAGTGSSKIRSNVSIGHGIYKSVDAGKTWQFSGLRDVGQISTIRTHPTNPAIVYVAALGNPFMATPDRGVYRTTDGGKTWKKVLFLSPDLGAADLELQPGNPQVIFACLWHGLRKPWTIISGAEEGGIYKSVDGGDTWTKLAGGLPAGLFGRSAVAISNANPQQIYALIEAKPGSGLYRSEDAGLTWKLINSSGKLTTRPFYYTTLGVDPSHPDIVWVGDEGWFKSTNGGQTFESSPVPHGDNHDVWINPKNSDIMIQANDGGANVSLDGGRTWSTQENQPTAEIYGVAVDDQFPYLVYGAQQDNTTVIVPSQMLSDGQPFRAGAGCETGPIIPDKDNPQIVYGGCKGQFTRMNLNANNEENYWIGAESLYGNAGSDLRLRFQRVSPMEVSPNVPHTVYYGSQYVHRTTDGGVTWEQISPDLTAHPPGTQGASGEPITRDATGEEVYSTLYSIRESPLDKNVIWTGSNDGLVYVTRNDGKRWSNVTPPGLPPGGRVQNIEPSPHQAGTAYVAIYRYLLGDFSPYIYRTGDFGKTWTRLTDGANGIAKDEPTRVVREDPDRPGLLYAGTEFGMYLSYDNGGHWQSLQLNLPVTPVTDIKVRHKDLILSTQGRSFWILDNLTPLHQLSQNTFNDAAYLFKPRTAVRTPMHGGFGMHRPDANSPQYPIPGATIDYYLSSEPSTDLTMEILDGSGTVIRTYSSAKATDERPRGDEGGGDEEEGYRSRPAPTMLEKTIGMHRFYWDLRYPGPWRDANHPQGSNGPTAPPGTYQVRLKSGSWVSTQTFHVVEDSRITRDGVTDADLLAQFQHNLKVRDLLSQANQTAAEIRALKTRLKDTAEASSLARVNELSRQFITSPVRYSKPALQTQIAYLYTVTNNSDQKIGQDVVARFLSLRTQLDQFMAELKAAVTPAAQSSSR